MSVEYFDSGLFKVILKNQADIDAKVEALQKAIAAFRAQLQDFRAEHEEDMQELKRRIWELQFMRMERA